MMLILTVAAFAAATDPSVDVAAEGVYSVGDQFVEHTGVDARVAVHLLPVLALELHGGYVVGGETGIMANVRNDGASAKRASLGSSCATATCEPQLPGLWQTTWISSLDVAFAPFHMDVVGVDTAPFIYGGLGVEGIHKQLNDAAYTSEQPRFSLEYGAGVRAMPWEHIGFELALHNRFAANPDVPENDPAQQRACSNGYLLTTGASRSCVADIDSSTWVAAGLVISF